MLTPLCLILVGLFSRLLPHPHNAVAVGAIALYAGARLPRRWAVVIPLAIFVVSDVFLSVYTWKAFQFYPVSQLTSYATFTLVAVLGGLVPKHPGAAVRLGMSVAASTLFFVASNFAVWLDGSAYNYGRDLSGLLNCYVLAVPFYWNTLAADLVGTVALFGLDALFNPAPVVEEPGTGKLAPVLNEVSIR
jgi:hypothetical protein